MRKITESNKIEENSSYSTTSANVLTQEDDDEIYSF
jgi:hypothetical protein